MRTRDFFWLVGLLEGEGSFFPGPPSNPNAATLCLISTDLDVVERVAELLDRKVGRHYHSRGMRERHPNLKATYKVRIVGGPAVEMMQRLRPYMGERRQAQMARAIESYKPVSRSRHC